MHVVVGSHNTPVRQKVLAYREVIKRLRIAKSMLYNCLKPEINYLNLLILKILLSGKYTTGHYSNLTDIPPSIGCLE